MPRSLLTLLLSGCLPPMATPDGARVDRGESRRGDSDATPCCGELPGDSGPHTRPIPSERDSAATTLSAPTVIYTVRHAEKASEGDDPGLTEEGTARAEALALLMADVPLRAIYATELRRTQDTVRPTAEDHGLPINIDFDPEDELAEHIRDMHHGETVLHAGHSYTLGAFMDALGVEDTPSGYDYGDLWIITLLPNGEVRLVESHYGE